MLIWTLWLCISTHWMLYRLAVGAEVAGSSQLKTAFTKPAIVLANAVLSTIVPTGELLRAPRSRLRYDAGTGTPFSRLHAAKTKHQQVFEVPDDPIKKAVWGAFASPVLFQKAAMINPLARTSQPTSRLLRKNTTTCSTTTCQSKESSRARMLATKATTLSEPLPAVQHKEGLLSKEGSKEDSAQLAERLFAPIIPWEYPSAFFRFPAEWKKELSDANVSGASEGVAWAGSLSETSDGIAARSHIIDFAREVGSRYGDPENYARVAAEFVDEFLSPAGLTVELARLMMEVDARTRTVAVKTSRGPILGTAVQSTDTTASWWRHQQRNGKMPEKAHMPLEFALSQNKSPAQQGVRAIEEAGSLELPASPPIKLSKGVTAPAEVAQEAATHNVLSINSKLSARPLFAGEAISHTFYARVKETVDTIARSLDHRDPRLEPLAPSEKGNQRGLDSVYGMREQSYDRKAPSEEEARFIIISFAGEIGNQKGTPEEYVRLATEFVDRYIQPAGWAKYIAGMIMEARRERENPSFRITDGWNAFHAR